MKLFQSACLTCANVFALPGGGLRVHLMGRCRQRGISVLTSFILLGIARFDLALFSIDRIVLCKRVLDFLIYSVCPSTVFSPNSEHGLQGKMHCSDYTDDVLIPRKTKVLAFQPSHEDKAYVKFNNKIQLT